MRIAVPWILSLLLAIGLGVQWKRADEARLSAAMVQAKASELSALYTDHRERYATWLAIGLRQFRDGNADAGFRALDSLLATTTRNLRAGSEAARTARAYLEKHEETWR